MCENIRQSTLARLQAGWEVSTLGKAVIDGGFTCDGKGTVQVSGIWIQPKDVSEYMIQSVKGNTFDRDTAAFDIVVKERLERGEESLRPTRQEHLQEIIDGVRRVSASLITS